MQTRFFISLLFISLSLVLHAQSINTEFGKNRVQYHDDFDTWYKYETENFITFHYGKSKNVAEVAVQIAEQVHDDIQNIMEHRINDKVRILVYTDVSDVKQSNIGLDDTFTSRPGETKIIGNKMFVYFDGNHQNLRRQIREGIASVYLSAMQFGDNFQEMVQNAVLLNLPEWYKRGIISYIGSYWNSNVDDELRDILAQKEKYYNFKKLSAQYPEIAGHSMWFYLDQKYGKSSISNILYLTRITRKIDNALLYVLNEDRKDIMKGWEEYFRNHYNKEPEEWSDNLSNELKIKKKTYIPISHLRLSPDGKSLAYVQNNIGKARVKIKNLETGKEKTIFRYGHKNSLQATDYHYPNIAWSPAGDEITILYEHKDVIKLKKYHVPSGKKVEQIIPTALQRIYSMDYITEDRYLFSASTGGYSDLFTYNFTGRQWQRVTNDLFDDLDATIAVVGGKEGILFSSNRTNNHTFPVDTDTIIPDGDFNLFFYDLEADDNSLLRLTNTPDVNERYPISVTSKKIVYLADDSGIQNRYVYDLTKNETWAASDFNRNIIRHHTVVGSNNHVYTYYHDGKYKVYFEELDWDQKVTPYETRFHNRATEINNKSEDTDVFIPFKPETLEKKSIPEGYKFQTEYKDPPQLEEIRDLSQEDVTENDMGIFLQDEGTKENPVHDFQERDIKVARLAFKLDNFTTKMDNEVLFEGLESFTGNSDELLNNPIGLLIKGNVMDLFEDYSFTGGARYPLTFDGSEYFLTYENRKGLWDKKYALYRRVKEEVVDPNSFPTLKAKKASLLAMAQYKYPFTIYKSLRFTGTLRFDRFFYLASDQFSYNAPNVNEKRLSAKVEYIYDNTIDVAINIKHGTRYKIYTEAINEFNIQLTDGAEFDASRGFTGIVGFDARHYIPLLEHSVIALRAAGAKSFGTKKNLYYLGGVNNNIVNPFNQDIPILPDNSFAYKTNVFHLRGFDTNIRNGSSYALINTEIRVPIFRYLMGKYNGSSFLRNFQIVGFADAGTAWYGSSPYSDENPLNVETVNAGDIITLQVKYFRDPLVMGYGGGIRLQLLSYTLRFDIAKGIETRRVQDAKYYFSIGTDF